MLINKNMKEIANLSMWLIIWLWSIDVQQRNIRKMGLFYTKQYVQMDRIDSRETLDY